MIHICMDSRSPTLGAYALCGHMIQVHDSYTTKWHEASCLKCIEIYRNGKPKMTTTSADGLMNAALEVKRLRGEIDKLQEQMRKAADVRIAAEDAFKADIKLGRMRTQVAIPCQGWTILAQWSKTEAPEARFPEEKVKITILNAEGQTL